VSPRITFATGQRVLLQVGHDRRTIALLLVVPSVLVALIKYVFYEQPVFDRIGPPLLGIFPLVSMFLVTSIAMLRERTTGTLERLLTMPLAKLDLLGGYAGSKWGVLLLAIANAVLGMALGLFVSAFARTEFQAVQFMPAFLLPQLLLCGLLTPRADMAPALEAVSWLLPMTYAYGALDLVSRGEYNARLAVYSLAVCGFIVLALVAGAATLRRRTP
jgi:ABC-2 type transport system permease protein